MDLLGRYSKHLPWSAQCAPIARRADSSSDRSEAPSDRPRPLQRLTASQLQELVNRYRRGETTYELAQHFGVHRHTVSAHLHRSGATMRRQGIDASGSLEAARLYSSGWSLARIGERLGVDPKTVSARLKDVGVPIRDSHGRTR